MATVTELLDRGSRVTGLRTTGSERELALQALQDSYRRVVMDGETFPEGVSHIIEEVGEAYDLNYILGSAFSKLLHASYNGQPLTQVSHQEMLDIRDMGIDTGMPEFYSVIGFDRIAIHPLPSIGDELSVWYLPDTPELVETAPTATQESTPSMVPVQFHWSVLFPGMVLELLDKDQRLEEGATWNARYERGIARLQEFMGQVAGNANRAYVKKRSGLRWNTRDERFR